MLQSVVWFFMKFGGTSSDIIANRLQFAGVQCVSVAWKERHGCGDVLKLRAMIEAGDCKVVLLCLWLLILSMLFEAANVVSV